MTPLHMTALTTNNTKIPRSDSSDILVNPSADPGHVITLDQSEASF